MRRLVWVALLTVAACSQSVSVESGPLDTFYRPTGIGVQGGALLVASANLDLLYDPSTGGSVISVLGSATPDQTGRVPRLGALNVESFAGRMAIADPADPRGGGVACPALAEGGPIALLAVRGADRLYRIRIGAGGALACDGCSVPLTGLFADAFALGVACGPGVARAYVGYLRSFNGVFWMTQVDLTKPVGDPGAIQHGSWGLGLARGFAYDPDHERLYVAAAGQGIRWIDLGSGPSGGCRIDALPIDGGCSTGLVSLPAGLEPRAVVLARRELNLAGPPRLYVLARVFDSRAAEGAGVRVGDVDGILLVADLVDDLSGQTGLAVRDAIRVGFGPQDLKLVPGRAGTSRRDVVAALSGDDPMLLLYDDDTGDTVYVGRDDIAPTNPAAPQPTGRPWIGNQPFGLAVDPVPVAGNAFVYVGSSADNYVSRIPVPTANVNGVVLPAPGGQLDRIFGGTP